MNPVFKYCLSSGVLPSAPKLLKSFYVPPFEKFIIVENNNLYKSYKNFNELMEYISPVLKKQGIKIVQIKTNPTDEHLDCVDKIIQNTYGQFCYLIEKSIMLISNSNLSCEFARVEQKPNFLFNERNCDFNKNPDWYPAQTFSFLLDAYSEEIAINIFNCLNISSGLSKINPVFQGKHFGTKIIEVIPNFDIKEMGITNQSLNVRADIHFDENNIIKIISQNKTNLITKKFINLNKLPPDIIKSNLLQINYEITESTSEEDVEKIKSFNLPINFFCRDLKNIQKIRLKFIDEKIEEEKRPDIKSLDISMDLCNNYYYKSSKMIISNKKFFTSMAAVNQDQPINPSERIFLEKVFNEESFWSDIEHYKLLLIDHES